MPTPVYIALHSVTTNLNMGSVHQRNLIGNTAMHDVPATTKVVTIGQTITAAYAWLQAQAMANGHAGNALYIYMGPEYLLQQSYAMRTVTEDEKSQIVNHIAAVSNACPGMLIMPGTLPWRKKKGFQRAFMRQAADAFNTAFIFWNGAMVHRHDKNEDVGELQASDLAKTTKYGGTRPRARFVHGAHTGRFQCNALNFGIEICGDHGAGTLVAGGQVDIHLLTSATVGHSFNALGIVKVAARDGGIFAHCNDMSGRGGTPFHGAWEIDRTANPVETPGVALGGAAPPNVVGWQLTLN
jgi:hypothetical protein